MPSSRSPVVPSPLCPSSQPKWWRGGWDCCCKAARPDAWGSSFKTSLKSIFLPSFYQVIHRDVCLGHPQVSQSWTEFLEPLIVIPIFRKCFFFFFFFINYLVWEGTSLHSASALRSGGDAIFHLGTRLLMLIFPNRKQYASSSQKAGFNTAFIACATSMKNGFQVSPLNIIWRFKAAHNPLYILFYILPVVWTT